MINLLVAASINLLWGAFHTMQIIGHFPLLNIMLPANAYWLFSAILKIATFDVLPVGSLISEFEESVGLEQDDMALSDTMADLGYDSTDPIKNLQIMFIFMVFLLLYPIVALCMGILICWSSKLKKCFSAINKPICWNVYIRFTFEAFLEIAITCLLRFKVFTFGSPNGTF